MAEQPVDEHPQGSDPAAKLTLRVTERLAEVDTSEAADRVAAELADHAARSRPLRPALHAHLDGALGPDDRPSLVVAAWTATAVRSRRRTGPRGGRRPGWFLPPTGSLDTPPDEQRGCGAAHELDLVPEEREDTGRIGRLQRHGDEIDA